MTINSSATLAPNDALSLIRTHSPSAVLKVRSKLYVIACLPETILGDRTVVRLQGVVVLHCAVRKDAESDAALGSRCCISGEVCWSATCSSERNSLRPSGETEL